MTWMMLAGLGIFAGWVSKDGRPQRAAVTRLFISGVPAVVVALGGAARCGGFPESGWWQRKARRFARAGQFSGTREAHNSWARSSEADSSVALQCPSRNAGAVGRVAGAWAGFPRTGAGASGGLSSLGVAVGSRDLASNAAGDIVQERRGGGIYKSRETYPVDDAVGMARTAGSGDCGVCDLGHLEVCGVRHPNLAVLAGPISLLADIVRCWTLSNNYVGGHGKAHQQNRTARGTD